MIGAITAHLRYSWRFRLVSVALMLRSYRLPLCRCRSGYKRAALPRLPWFAASSQNASRLASQVKSQDATPSKVEGENQAMTCAPSLGHKTGPSKLLLPKFSQTCPYPQLPAESQVEPECEQQQGLEPKHEIEKLYPEKKKKVVDCPQTRAR